MALKHVAGGKQEIRVDVVIANGTSQSDEVLIPEDMILVGVFMPGAWTAAAITFLARRDTTETAIPVYDLSAEISATSAAADRYIVIEPTKLVGIPFLTLRSGTAAAAVNQLAERTISLVFRRVE